MIRPRPWFGECDAEEEANRQTTSLAGLAVALLLVVLALFLVRALRTSADREDCLLAGRTACEMSPANNLPG